jgi:hypothetical protein
LSIETQSLFTPTLPTAVAGCKQRKKQSEARLAAARRASLSPVQAMRGPAFFGYADNYLIDVSFGVIVDVEASRAVAKPKLQPPGPCSNAPNSWNSPI